MKTSNKILGAFFSLIILCSIITMAYIRMGTSERKPLEANGPVTTKEYTLDSLNALEISVGNVQLLPGDPKVEIICADNIREKLNAGIDEDKFYIHTKHNVKDLLVFDVKVYTNDLEKIYLYDEASISNEGTFKTDTIKIKTFNASKVNMNLETDYLRLLASNATVINLKGTTNRLDVEANNAGRIEAENLVAKEVDVNVSNAGSISIHAAEKLSVNINNAGRVNYIGQPQIMRNSVSSGGRLNSMNEAN